MLNGMGDDGNGRATIREVHDLLTAFRQEVNGEFRALRVQLEEGDQAVEGRLRALELWQASVTTGGRIARAVASPVTSIGVSVIAALILVVIRT